MITFTRYNCYRIIVLFTVLNWQFLTWIWRPDTYFMNGQDSYLHKVAVPNRFIRLAGHCIS